MSNILIINIDSAKITNVALSKIDYYHRQRGDDVVWDMPMMRDWADKIYVSCVFDWNKDKCKEWEGIAEIGGTGYDIKKVLPPEIEEVRPKINVGFTSRGCIRNCISGNTLVQTVEGDIPIKNLVGRNEIGVYTYDPKTGETLITAAKNICWVGKKEGVRVLFDNGTHIDCTPDHRFLTFINGNQFCPTKETVREAKELASGDSVIAVRFWKRDDGAYDVFWRRKRQQRHRMVMEYMIGRKLVEKEVVHHKDKNRMNDLPENLLLCNNQKEHISLQHPEISERMKLDNPQKYCTEESYRKMKEKTRGQKRNYESRLKYRESKLGVKNPNYKDGKTAGRMTRMKEENHKVVGVIPIGKIDVFDLEVPETHWFFANNVLVHNCEFCVVPQKEGKSRATGDIYDFWDGESEKITVLDNNILALKKHFEKIAGQIKKEKLIVDFNAGMDIRVATEEQLDLLKELKPYNGYYKWAWDGDEDLTKKFEWLQSKLGKQLVYIIVGFLPFERIREKVETLKAMKMAPYIMRHISVYHDPLYVNFAQWVNQPRQLFTTTFEEFQGKQKARKEVDLQTLNLFGGENGN